MVYGVWDNLYDVDTYIYIYIIYWHCVMYEKSTSNKSNISYLKFACCWIWFYAGSYFEEGLPYISRVHLSEGSLARSLLRSLYTEEPVVRRSFIPKFILSEGWFVPKIRYSEKPSTIWILCPEGSLVRSSSSPKGAMFRRFYIPKRAPPLYGFYITKVIRSEVPLVRRLLCSEDTIFRTSPAVHGFCVTKFL